ncbi:ATP-binding protein [Murdochiella massiliensis]|uniref:ATP-binding protein n=1 Tax=Murdochiella massiliensis TaxID=1673723 RepID=UPI00083764CD|nr:hypothetical protein [Murdochiella massiliensis]
MKPVELCIPSQAEYVTTLRLVTASIAQKMQFDMEAIDDLRVCVSEAVNYLLPSNEKIRVRFLEEEDRLVIEIFATGEETRDEGYMLHRQIMETLLDGVETDNDTLRLIKLR